MLYENQAMRQFRSWQRRTVMLNTTLERSVHRSTQAPFTAII